MPGLKTSSARDRTSTAFPARCAQRGSRACGSQTTAAIPGICSPRRRERGWVYDKSGNFPFPLGRIVEEALLDNLAVAPLLISDLIKLPTDARWIGKGEHPMDGGAVAIDDKGFDALEPNVRNVLQYIALVFEKGNQPQSRR